MTHTPTPGLPLQLRGVSKHYGPRRVLHDTQLSIAPGEFVAVVGRSGCGKSTLLRLIASAVSPTRGEGRIFGYDLRDRQSVRDHVHLLGHDLGLYPDLTPRENLHFALRMHTQTGDVDAALARVDLTRAADRRVRFLSAGMKKRLALTRLTLLSRPLALVDEPFANLDAQGRELAIELLTEARAAGSTLIVAAHEPELSLRVAARALQRLPGDRRAFLLLNFAATHAPTHPYLPGHHRDSTRTQQAALASVDAALPTLLAALQARGDTLLVVCADHGTCFGDDGYWGHRVAHPCVWTVPYAETILPGAHHD